MRILRTSGISNKHRPLYILLLSVLILGIITGALTIFFFDFKRFCEFDILHQNYIFTGSVRIFDLFLKNIKFPLALYVTLFICGFSAVLQPVELFCVFFSGLACGISVTYYYAFFGFRGVLVSLLLVVPFFLLKSLVLIALAQSSLRLSGYIGKVLKGTCDDEYAVRFYCHKFLIMIVITTVVCTVQAIFTTALRGIL